MREKRGSKKGATPGANKPGALAQLKGNPKNPRKPWTDEQRSAFQKSLAEFGDLGGIVFNLTTKQLVGGHKRVGEFREDAKAKVVITDKLAKPDAAGTTAYGYVTLASGTRFSYREVKWPKAKESAANLAANKWGAEWELEQVASFLSDISEAGIDPLLTGFSLEEVGELSRLEGDRGGKEFNAPESFPEFGEGISTEHRCPKCGYEWSGKSQAGRDEDGEHES